MDMIEELLESVCAELEACGHPELVAEVRAILTKVEAIEEPEGVEEEEPEYQEEAE